MKLWIFVRAVCDFVIASESEAIQRSGAAMDCFVASLLAMTTLLNVSRLQGHRTSLSHSSSLNTVTPNSVALLSFEPAPGPATT